MSVIPLSAVPETSPGYQPMAQSSRGQHPELHLALGGDALGILDLQVLTMGSQESGGWVFR